MSEIQIGETVSDEQIANAAYAAGVASERARIVRALREDYEQTPATAAEFADEIESGRL